jgi:hypothetical protein
VDLPGAVRWLHLDDGAASGAHLLARRGAIFVLPCMVALDLSGEPTCDWRDGDVW